MAMFDPPILSISLSALGNTLEVLIPDAEGSPPTGGFFRRFAPMTFPIGKENKCLRADGTTPTKGRLN